MLLRVIWVRARRVMWVTSVMRVSKDSQGETVGWVRDEGGEVVIGVMLG